MNEFPCLRNQPALSNLKGVLIALIFAIAVCAIYGQVIDHEFVNFDDHGYVTHNPHVIKGLTVEGLLWAWGFANDLYWHPMTWLSHMLDVDIFGMNAAGHLLMNMILHLLNTFVLFALLMKMTGSLYRSALVAALFAVHPLNVESVAWVAARKNLLSTFFWLLTIRLYLVYCRRSTLYAYLLVLCVFLLGLMTKPMLITLPFVLLLLDFWPLSRFRFGESRIKNGQTDFNRVGFLTLVVEKIPLLLLSVISVFISVTSVKGSTVSFDTVPLLLRLCNAVWSYLHYLFKFIWPVNLAVYYPYPSEIPLWQTAGAGLIVAAMTLAVIRMSVRRPYLIVGWFWYLGTLVPVSGILQVGLWPAMADRWAYIPLIGVYIICVWGSADLVSNWPRRRAVPTVLAAIIICFFTVTAWSQTRHWRDSIALFKRAVTVTGANPVALNNLGNTYLGRGQVEEAIAQFSAAIELNPRYARALNNQGVALARKGDPNAAVDYYRRALRVIPTYAEAHNNLGAALRVQGRYAAAIVHYTKAIQLKPNYAAAHYNLALAFIHSGRPQLAVDHLRNALEINPNNTAAAETLEAALRLVRSRKLVAL